MRTLLLLTIINCWGCVLFATSLHFGDDMDREKHHYEDLHEVEMLNESGKEKDEEEDEVANAEDDDEDEEDSVENSDMTDADLLLDVTTPYNFLRYFPQIYHAQKFPRFAVINPKMFQVTGNVF
ncbi:hypothetical protein KR222_006053 [Zaprionus bogoriensis]|nr:hypothetical protein KR222_006053 [Zaprionus bogoriensis]